VSNPKHVLVSGGGTGLGNAIVLELLAAGYAVSTFSRGRAGISERTAQHGERFCHVQADITDTACIPGLVERVVEQFGAPYALINNAAIARHGVLASAPPADIDAVLATNLAGALHLTRSVVRTMLLGRGGRIINVSSIVGIRGYRGLSIYAATKAGMDGMTRALARELGRREITVNSIAPGYLETRMTDDLSEAQRNRIVARTPLNRLGRVDDVTGLILFLLSDAARFITGQVIAVDGGLSC
jgi:3-oxoacyl-[acyl-carrier protein] reductase